MSAVYYDRHIDNELADCLNQGGPLSWMVKHVQTRHAHLQFRRARSGIRQRGSVELYWGRTSPLEVQSRRGGRVRLNADKAYRAQSEFLFSDTILISKLGSLENKFRGHHPPCR